MSDGDKALVFSGERALDLREEKGWTQMRVCYEIFKKTGQQVAPQKISALESGTTPLSSLGYALLIAFGAKPEDLMEWVEFEEEAEDV